MSTDTFALEVTSSTYFPSQMAQLDVKYELICGLQNTFQC